MSGKLLANLSMSLTTLAIGFCLAVLFGIVVGLLMGRFRAVEHFLDLYVNALMSAPTTAFVPVLILWFGLGVESRIAVVFLFAVFVIIINTMTGVKQVDTVLVEMARSFGAREREVFFKIILPAALPAIMAGFRLGHRPRRQGHGDGGNASHAHRHRRHDYAIRLVLRHRLAVRRDSHDFTHRVIDHERGAMAGPPINRMEGRDRYRIGNTPPSPSNMEGGFSNPPFNHGQECPRSKRRKEVGTEKSFRTC